MGNRANDRSQHKSLRDQIIAENYQLNLLGSRLQRLQQLAHGTLGGADRRPVIGLRFSRVAR